MDTLHIIDSHTGGEPTRVVISGSPDLGTLALDQCVVRLREQYDHLRTAIVCEPRGSDVIVGAYLLPPRSPDCCASVIFFNNVDYLGMCGHGTIGLIVTLAYLGRIQPGTHRIETPVGKVDAQLHDDGSVTVHNVPAYRLHKQIALELPGHGRIHGDVAWGGNWFFLCSDHGLTLEAGAIDQLTEFCWSIRLALQSAGITGLDGALIDHIELFGPPVAPQANSRNFVLCPGKAYDRSPCGTGTSAKLACLAADGVLSEHQPWLQESIVGSSFLASYVWSRDSTAERPCVLPSIRGHAYLTAEARLLFDPRDPFAHGLTPSK